MSSPNRPTRPLLLTLTDREAVALYDNLERVIEALWSTFGGALQDELWRDEADLLDEDEGAPLERNPPLDDGFSEEDIPY